MQGPLLSSLPLLKWGIQRGVMFQSSSHPTSEILLVPPFRV
jgi:hypothetical protein